MSIQPFVCQVEPERVAKHMWERFERESRSPTYLRNQVVQRLPGERPFSDRNNKGECAPTSLNDLSLRQARIARSSSPSIGWEVLSEPFSRFTNNRLVG